MIDVAGSNFEAFLAAYSQIRYDFEMDAFDRTEIREIKKLAREKRAAYGLEAPLGRNIFRYIASKEQHVFFESQHFDNPCLDAFLFIPPHHNENVFIVLNSQQPLVNQIFAAAHEYYHYLIHRDHHVCSLADLKDKEEQKASRFAAEFLLPDEALRKSIERWLEIIHKNAFKEADKTDVVILCYGLTIHYELPLKAVIYRLAEEHYIDDVSTYMDDYEFIKKTFHQAIVRDQKQAKELISNENPYIDETMYDLLINAYRHGYVSFSELEKDIQMLKLNSEILTPFREEIMSEEDDEELPDHLKESLSRKILDSQVE
jgi:Zn-dependent peptidase ImmA (M78 family)